MSALILAGMIARGAAAQPLLGADGARSDDASAVRGLVIDATTDRPIAGARVALCAEPAACRCDLRAGRPVAAARTDSAGAYAIAALAPGSYAMCVSAVGYRPRALTVTLDPVATARLHVGLPPVPRVLGPVRITQTPDQTLRRLADRTGADGASPPAVLTSERIRQARYLTSDARLLTRDAVVAAPAFGESDVMRALQQLVGVSGRDDYTAAPWARGAPGDQTVVTFDGVPLFDPYHGAGAVSTLNVDGLGDVAFHPGVAPAALAGGGAATLALRAARPSAMGVHAAVALSGIAGTARVEGTARDGRAAGVLAVRRSHLDVTNGFGVRLGHDSARGLPYAFGDAIARGDIRLGGGWRAEASGLAAGDRLWAPVPGIVDGGAGRWGSGAARVRVARATAGGSELRFDVGASVAYTDLAADLRTRLEPAGVVGDATLFAVRESVFRPQPIDGRVQARVAAVSWQAGADDVGVPRGAAGLELSAWRAGFATSGPWPHTSQFVDTLDVRSATTFATVWAQRRWRPLAALRVETGARLELGGATRNAPAVRLAPRVTARYALSPTTVLSAAAGAAYQHAQTLAPPGPGRNAVATTDALWAISGPEVPVLGARTATLGAERWLTSALLASATAYWRDAVGVLLPDPRPGYLVDRPLAVEGRGRATGVEASLRGLGRRWTGAVSYAAGRSTLSAYGLRFAAPSERPAVLRANVGVRLGAADPVAPNARVSLGWERAGGAPFTRYYDGLARCDAAGRCRWTPAPRVDAPSGGRGAPTRRLDATVDASRPVGGLRLGGFVQLRNLTRAANDAAYLATVGRCAPGTQAAGTCHPELMPQAVEDTRLPALRGWLSVGLRLAERGEP